MVLGVRSSLPVLDSVDEGLKTLNLRHILAFGRFAQAACKLLVFVPRSLGL